MKNPDAAEAIGSEADAGGPLAAENGLLDETLQSLRQSLDQLDQLGLFLAGAHLSMTIHLLESGADK